MLLQGPTQKDSVEADEAVVMQSCTEGGLLCGGLCPEPTLCQAVASPDRCAAYALLVQPASLEPTPPICHLTVYLGSLVMYQASS